MNLGLPTVNTPDEFNTFGTPATRVRRPIYGSHLSALGHVFGEVTAVGMSGKRSEKTIAKKLILKLRGKIRILGAKIFL